MNSDSSLRSRESTVGRWALFVCITAIWSGLATWIWGIGNAFLQLSVLVHVVSGTALSALGIVYLVMHFRRVLGVRRPKVFITGLIGAFAVVVAVASGCSIVISGVNEQNRWLLDLHIFGSFLSIGFGLAHWVTYLLSPRRNAKVAQGAARGSFPVTSFVASTAVVVSGAVVAVLLHTYVQPIESTPAVANYSLPYGSHPFRPSRTETHHGRFIPEKQLAQSDDCASCHKDIAKQWQVSAHRHAADDPAYVTNIKLLIETQGIAAARYCEGCHAPVALLSGQLSPGGTHGGIEGSPANVEGVGCVGCHGMNSIVDTKGVASFEMGAPSSYLFSYSDSSIAQSIRHQIIKLSPDMHRREMTPRGVNDSSFCASCHVQFMDEEVNHWGWVQMQDDYSAWLESPFSGLNSDEFGKTTTARCQDCHMPATVASDPSSNRDGSISAHYFTGANTMLAMHFGHEQHLRRTKEFLRAGQLTITIEPPHRRDAVQTLQSIRESVRATSETPAYVLVGDRVDISVTLSNRGVGHDFPGGTIDINEAWIEFLVIDGGGKEVYSSGKISGDDYSVLGVDPDAEFYRSRPVDRTGSLVWKHDLFRRTGIAEKRVIASGKSDLLRYEFAVPDWVAPPLTIVASLKYRKLNDRYARWALGDSYSDLPVVSLARDSIIVPVRTELDTRSID